jgi:hypothetical protein
MNGELKINVEKIAVTQHFKRHYLQFMCKEGQTTITENLYIAVT